MMCILELVWDMRKDDEKEEREDEVRQPSDTYVVKGAMWRWRR